MLIFIGVINTTICISLISSGVVSLMQLLWPKWSTTVNCFMSFQHLGTESRMVKLHFHLAIEPKGSFLITLKLWLTVSLAVRDWWPKCFPSFLLRSWQDAVMISSVSFQRMAVAYSLHHIFTGKGQIQRSEDQILRKFCGLGKPC